jgi:hypothetical protein
MARTRLLFEDFLGINNRAAPERLDEKELREAENVDIDNSGRVRRRLGRKRVYTGNEVHSLWSDGIITLFAQGRYLMKLTSNNVGVALRTDLMRGAPVSYESVNGVVYWSNGFQKGRVRNEAPLHWGIVPPPAPVVALRDTGGLPQGTYMVKAVYVDSYGEESGASYATSFETGANQSAIVSLPSFPLEAATAKVFMTSQNGDVYYYQGNVSAGQGLIVTTVETGVPLRTEHLYPPPVGSIVRYFAGRMYVVTGNVLWFSEPYALSLFNPRKNFYQFPGAITMVEPVEGGLFVSYEGGKTVFLSGTSIEDTQELEVDELPAIRGTSVTTKGEWFPALETTGTIAIWVTREGPTAGLPNGAVRRLTSERLSLPETGFGSGLIRHERGSRHYVGTLRDDGGQAGNLYATDRVVAEVYRNGVLI